MIKNTDIVTLFLFSMLSACTEQTLPAFDDPVPMSISNGKAAIGPRLSQRDTEGAILSWMVRDKESPSLQFSSFEIDAWDAPQTVVIDDAMFVNWADLPGVVPLGGDSLFAHWLSYVGDAPYAYQVLSAFSADNGATWSEPLAPHTDGTPTEHGFVSTFQENGATSLIWLDGRETEDGGMTLRGATLTSQGDLQGESVLDELVCDCCQTDVATTKDGAVAVYRNRTSDEIRDIYVARRVAGQWLPGAPVSNDAWVIEGCPVNGPSIDAAEDRVAVAWFTGANDTSTVYTATSTNGGQSFSEPLEIASKDVLGRVGVAMIDRHTFAVSWLEPDKKGSYAINLRAVTFDGQLGRVETVGRTSVAYSVPQMVRVEDELLFAWTDTINDASKIASVSVKILGFYN